MRGSLKAVHSVNESLIMQLHAPAVSDCPSQTPPPQIPSHFVNIESGEIRKTELRNLGAKLIRDANSSFLKKGFGSAK